MRRNGNWNGKDLLRVAQLGLDHRERLVVRSMLRQEPELQRYCTLCECPEEEPPAHIFLVNADDPGILERLKTLTARDPAPVTVYVSAHDRHPEGIPVLRKPIVLRQLLRTLTGIISANRPD